MSSIQRFEDLEAWKIARELTKNIYGLTRGERFARDFGLKDQICRSAVSVMSNVAEGFERDGDKEYQLPFYCEGFCRGNAIAVIRCPRSGLYNTSRIHKCY